MTTAAEKRHMGRVAELSCACCGAEQVHVHHIREGQGGGQRSSPFLCIPLCPECHTGTNGLHGNKSLMRIQKLDELDMLADTVRRLTQ